MSRRSRGEGSIYQRVSDGRWVAVVSLGWRGSKRLRKSHYAATKREAQRWLRDTLRKLDDGIDPYDDRRTVGSVLDAWLETVKKSRRPKTYAAYELTVRRHLLPELGRIQLTRLRPADVTRLLETKHDEGLAPRNVHIIHGTLRTALNAAVRLQQVGQNVAALVQPPEAKQFPAVILTVEQARALLDAIAGHRFEAFVVVGLSLGLRAGEILGLRWSDIDIAKAELELGSQVQYLAGRGWMRAPMKSGEPRRLPLTSLAVAALHTHRQQQIQDRLAAEVWRTDEELIFTMEDGRPLHGRTVQVDLDRIIARLGLPRMRLHDLRHSCATLLMAQGVQLKVIQEILGHANLSTTEKIYVQVLPSVSKDAAERLERALRPAQDAR